MPLSPLGFPISRMDARAGFLVIEHAVIHVSGAALEVKYADGSRVHLPVARLSTLFVGPGCSVTTDAVDLLASMGTGIVWARGGAARFIGHGKPACTTGRTAMAHAQKWANPIEHLIVVREMYAKRFGAEFISDGDTLKVLRGKEGARVKKVYAALSSDYAVPWSKRTPHLPHAECDVINKALNTAHHIMDGVCHSIIEGMGYVPQLGFIHTDSVVAFTLDISDLYKSRYADPVAFRVCANRDNHQRLEGAVRDNLRAALTADKVYAEIATDLTRLIGGPDEDFTAETTYWEP